MHKAYKKTEITRIMEPLSPTPQDNQNPVAPDQATPPAAPSAPTPATSAPDIPSAPAAEQPSGMPSSPQAAAPSPQTPMPATPAPMPAAPAPAPQAPMPSPVPMGAPAPQMQQSTPMAGQPAPSMGSAKPKVPKLAKMIIIGLVALLVLGGGGFGIFKLVGSLGGLKLEGYTNSKYDFSVSFPEGWEEDKFDDTRIAFSEPEDETDESDTERFRAVMNINVLENAADSGQEFDGADDFLDQIKESIEDVINDSSSNDSEYARPVYGEPSSKRIKVNGYEAVLIKADTTDGFGYEEGEKGSTALVMIYINENLQIGIDVDAHETDSEYYEAFDDIISTFKYEG